MKKKKLHECTDSYMYLLFNISEGEAAGDQYQLKVPTFWDSVKNQWMATLQLPKSKKIIHVHGKDSFELQNNFNVELTKTFRDPLYQEELQSLFVKLKD